MTWIDEALRIGLRLLDYAEIIASILAGYWMGRNSSGKAMVENPKPPKPKKPAPRRQDPYEAALMPDRSKSIPTIEED